MKKVFVFFAVILLAVLLIFACELPSSIKFKSDDFKINAPVKIGRVNLATVISAMVKDAFPESFEVYDMVDHQDFQAFLIGYEMVVMESFDPDEYLDDIRRQMDKMNQLASNGQTSSSITIKNMTTPLLENDPYQYFDMTKFFENMRTTINNNSCLETSGTIPSYTPSTLSQPVPSIPAVLQDLPAFMAFVGGGTSGESNFDSIEVDEGEIELNIWLEGVSDPNLTVTLPGIELWKAPSDPLVAGPPIPPATLSSDNNYSTTVTVNIDGVTITKYNPPQFYLGSIMSEYAGSTSTSVSSYKLFVRPQIKEGIFLSDAFALKRGTTDDKIPDEIAENIEMTPDAHMVNAQIKTGKFRMTVESPHYINPNTNADNGLNIGYQIVMQQAPPDYNLPSSQCLNNIGFTDTDYLLDDHWISGKLLTVKPFPDSKIIITADDVNGSTFKLVGKQLLIKMDMGMDIEELKKVRWKTKDEHGDPILPIEVPPLDFSSNDDAPVIRSINFTKMQMDVDFLALPEELEGHVALRVNSPLLGFNNSSSPHPNPKKLVLGEANVFAGSTPKRLNVGDSPHIEINATLLPVIDGQVQNENFPYMEFGEVDMSGGQDKVLNIYAVINLDYEWDEAEVNMHAALKNSNRDDPEGIVPEDAEDAVDLSDLKKYMHGITFGGGVQAKVFLGGPHKLIEAVQPKIDFWAQWEDDNLGTQTELLLTKHEFKIGDVLPKLPGKDSRGEFVYSGLAMPEPDKGLVLTGSFNRIFSSVPRNLRFGYEMILPGDDNPLTVTHDTFGDDVEQDAGKMRALLVILLPMEFIAEPGGYLAIPDLFEEDEDLFSRKSPEDSSLFTGVNINKLNMRMNFGYSFLSGSNLHFDRHDVLFGEDGLPLGEKNSVKITFTGKQQNIINKNLIYPDIKFVFPRERTLRIGRYSLPLKIVLDASGSYTLDLDDFDWGN